MLNFQIRDDTVNLTFSKEFSSTRELVSHDKVDQVNNILIVLKIKI